MRGEFFWDADASRESAEPITASRIDAL